MFDCQNVTLGFRPWSAFDKWIVPMVPGRYTSISLSPSKIALVIPGFKAIMMSVLVAGNGFRGRIWSPKNPRFNIESIFKPSDLFTLPFLLSMPMKTRQLYHQIEGVVYLVPLTKANEVTLKSPSQCLIDPLLTLHPWVWCLSKWVKWACLKNKEPLNSPTYNSFWPF